MNTVFVFLLPAFIGLYFLIGALSGGFGGGRRGGSGRERGYDIPNWARLVCLVLGAFGALSRFLLFRHFNDRL
jgi:hypothetical protein